MNELLLPRVLVVGPGGIKGFKILGFLTALEDKRILDHVDTFCGVSVGAIICLLIVAGYTTRDILTEAIDLDIFKDVHLFDFSTMVSNKGLMSNESIRSRLIQLLTNKFGNVPSLYGLYMRTGRSLALVTLNTTDHKSVVMTPFNNPDISCVDAVMLSINIPFIFYELIYLGKVYVDGALANPYPVDYFDDNKTRILGIYVKTLHDNTGNISDDNILVYCSKIVHSLIEQRRNHIISQASSHCRHVCLLNDPVNIIGYSITLKDKAQMLVEGFLQGRDYLNQPYLEPVVNREKYEYPEYYLSPEIG